MPGGGGSEQEAQRRVTAVFPRFATVALGLEDEAVHMLTDWLPSDRNAICAVGEAIRS